MTRKDYELIAKAIKDSCRYSNGFSGYDMDVVKSTMECLADALKIDNPRFDPARFLKACGIED